MKTDDVPQETSRTYGGVKKLVYAVDETGEYRAVKSAGWAVEAYATITAVDELERQCHAAWHAARDGSASPLAYHMYRRRMDPTTLAAAAGVWRWQLERHRRPGPFARLGERQLSRYAEALGVTVEALCHLPDHPPYHRPDLPDG